MPDSPINPDRQLSTTVLERAEANARRLADGSHAESTVRAYEHDWDTFTSWCELVDLAALPADEKTVASFLGHEQDRGLAPSTLNRRLAAINLVHELAGFPTFADKAPVRRVMKGARRLTDHRTRPKAAVFSEQIRAMADAADTELNLGVRDRALLLVGFAGAFRRSELVAIDLEDLVFGPVGVDVTLWRSKTDQARKSVQISIPASSSPYCPVAALKRWLEVAGVDQGPVFLRMHRNDVIGKRRLSAQTVALIVKRYAKAAGLVDLARDPKGKALEFSGHSLRRGFLSSAARNGASLLKMAAHSRHKSYAMLQGYVEAANRFEDHPGEGLL